MDAEDDEADDDEPENEELDNAFEEKQWETASL